MSLNSFSFLLFLPLVVLVNFSIPRKYRYIWLCAASLLFYLSNDVRFGMGLAFCTITTYVSGLLLQKAEGVKRKIILFLCIFGNITVLLLFRHSLLSSFFVPIGISFYALQAMGYVIDIYRGKIKAEGNLLKYTLFVAFFPTVISGPIQRGGVLLQQIGEGREFDYEKARSGLYNLLRGYLLKLVMANQFGTMVDYAYGDYANLPGAVLLWATFLYAIQLYCDFAGYSALAVGSAKILGFDMEDNFSQPYFATSIKDFWRRWHISLSSWLRDYVYISLGGNRKGKWRKHINLMLTFLVSGLWHGSGINFLIWGAMHGSYQIVESSLPERKAEKRSIVYSTFRMAVTFLLVDFAWLFFRAESLEQALAILYRIVFCFQWKEMTYYGSYLLGGSKWNLLFMVVGMVLVFLVDWLHEKRVRIESITARSVPVVVRWTAYVALTLLILLVVVRNYGQAASTFIYARF